MKPLFLVPMIFATACTKEPEVDHCLEASAHTAAVTLGTGQGSFETIEEGQLLKPYWGPQGGHHIWASLQAVGLNPGQGEMVPEHTGMLDGGYSSLIADGNDPVLVTVEVSIPGHELGPYQGSYTNFLSGNEAAAELLGLTAIISLYDIVEEFPDLESIPASLWISVVDGCGTVVTDRKNFEMQLTDVEGIYSYDD